MRVSNYKVVVFIQILKFSPLDDADLLAKHISSKCCLDLDVFSDKCYEATSTSFCLVLLKYSTQLSIR